MSRIRSLFRLAMVAIRRMMKPFNWEDIREIVDTKVISGIFFWLFVLPPLASIASSMEKAFGGIYVVLPITWVLLYFAAVCFAVAKVVYWLCCPKIIKFTRSYAEFLNRGSAEKEIKEWFVELSSIDKSSVNLRAHNLVSFIQTAKGSSNISHQQFEDLLIGKASAQTKFDFWNEHISQEYFPDIYFFVRKHSLFQNPKCRKFISWLVKIGFCLFGAVLIINFFNVVLYYIP